MCDTRYSETPVIDVLIKLTKLFSMKLAAQCVIIKANDGSYHRDQIFSKSLFSSFVIEKMH